MFAKADKDNSRTIDEGELRALLVTGMKLNLTSSDVDGIFLMLDFDGDRQISLPEFQQDFDHTVATDIAVLLAEAAPSKEQA